jgi:hypothetical protein
MAKGTSDFYKFYSKRNNTAVDHLLFGEILRDFNSKVMDSIIEGYEFELGHRLATIRVSRCQLNPAKARIDWGASNACKQEILDSGGKLYDAETNTGEKWLIYFTKEMFLKFHWTKTKAKVVAKKMYRFDAARGNDGKSPKEKLKAVLYNDDLAYLRYKKNVNI